MSRVLPESPVYGRLHVFRRPRVHVYSNGEVIVTDADHAKAPAGAPVLGVHLYAGDSPAARRLRKTSRLREGYTWPT
jgi:hypothetical protein